MRPLIPSWKSALHYFAKHCYDDKLYNYIRNHINKFEDKTARNELLTTKFKVEKGDKIHTICMNNWHKPILMDKPFFSLDFRYNFVFDDIVRKRWITQDWSWWFEYPGAGMVGPFQYYTRAYQEQQEVFRTMVYNAVFNFKEQMDH